MRDADRQPAALPYAGGQPALNGRVQRPTPERSGGSGSGRSRPARGAAHRGEHTSEQEASGQLNRWRAREGPATPSLGLGTGASRGRSRPEAGPGPDRASPVKQRVAIANAEPCGPQGPRANRGTRRRHLLRGGGAGRGDVRADRAKRGKADG